jgi:hypothetical protein
MKLSKKSLEFWGLFSLAGFIIWLFSFFPCFAWMSFAKLLSWIVAGFILFPGRELILQFVTKSTDIKEIDQTLKLKVLCTSIVLAILVIILSSLVAEIIIITLRNVVHLATWLVSGFLTGIISLLLIAFDIFVIYQFIKALSWTSDDFSKGMKYFFKRQGKPKTINSFADLIALFLIFKVVNSVYFWYDLVTFLWSVIISLIILGIYLLIFIFIRKSLIYDYQIAHPQKQKI